MRFKILICALYCFALGNISAYAQTPQKLEVRRTYMEFGPAKALFYQPQITPEPDVAFLTIHRTANFLEHASCVELSQRGYAALCMNTRFEGSEYDVDWDRMALDVKAGIEFLRKQAHIKKIILFAHSGGGPTLSFYQAVAEKGISYCQNPDRIWPCRDDLANLPKADAIVFADAHPGPGVNALRNISGAVVNEQAGQFDESLDPFNPKNGYNPQGISTYSAEFQKRYYAAQSNRMNHLIETAQKRMAAIRAGKSVYPDNDVLIIPHGGNPGAGPGGTSQLQSFDTHVASRSTAAPHKLLRDDGSIVTQIIASVGPPDLTSAKRTRAFDTGTKVLTLRSFLSTNAIKSKNSYDDIDYCSANSSTICALQNISVPLLVTGMGAHYFIRDSENEYNAAASSDKDIIYIEGATHFFGPCQGCAEPPEHYAHSRTNLFDYVAKWTSQHIQSH
jgi:hypothetical protein